jgi:hypothetical protein
MPLQLVLVACLVSVLTADSWAEPPRATPGQVATAKAGPSLRVTKVTISGTIAVVRPPDLRSSERGAGEGKTWCIVTVEFGGPLKSEWVSTREIRLVDKVGSTYEVTGVAWEKETTFVLGNSSVKGGATLLFSLPAGVTPAEVEAPGVGRVAVPPPTRTTPSRK